MILNYLKSTLRNLNRNKFHTVLNITGLSIGLAAFILILLYVRDELTYDKSNDKYDRIYRLESNFSISGRHEKFAIVPIPMGPAFKLEFPEVENTVRLLNTGNTLIRSGDKEYYEENFYFADSTIFDIFSYHFILGSPEKALTEPLTMVLTRKTARKYFGDENPVGQVLRTGNDRSCKITGVIEDLPVNSHLKFDALLSATSLMQGTTPEDFNSMDPIRFWNIGVYTYILLNKNASIEAIYDKFPHFYEKYMKPIGDQINSSFELMTTPLAEQHFSSGLSSDLPTGNKAYIYIFTAVAIFILLIAAINYMNMATAKSSNRAREVGVRKVVGAHRTQLIKQFLSESLLLSVLALVISLVLVYLLMHDFNVLTGKELNFSMLRQPVIFLSIILVTLLVGLTAGSYPAFFLSSFQPVNVLKGRYSGNVKRTGLLRKILVVFQFFIAIDMIIATLVVTHQLNFMRHKDLGFNKENLVLLELQDTAFRNKAESFKKELLTDPDITDVTNATGVPGQINWIQVVRVETPNGMKDNALILAQTDFDFIKTMGMQIVKGRDFDRNMGTDKEEAVIINETGVKTLGWEDDPIGKKIQYGFDLEGSQGRILKVIGVVKDFNFRSLHNKIEPVILFISPVPRYIMAVRIKGDNLRSTLGFIESKWHDFGAKRPFDYEFMDQSLDEMYQAEHKLGIIFRIAAFITIFIALLGLLGLSSFIAEQRTKEIGIRKVHGATMGNITELLLKEFIMLILIAFIIAVPLAWWRLSIWIDQSFIYHDRIRWVTFAIAGLLALGIGTLTISFYILRAATASPVNAIKYE
jgi:putative ABC transport system permease protein